MIVEVNGIKYESKQEPRKPKKFSKSFFTLYSMAMMFGGMDFMPRFKTPDLDGVDIVEEYGLIQLKKSNLSRSKRDYIVRYFESKFKKL